MTRQETSFPVNDETLQRFVDGELPRERFLEMQALLEADPAVKRKARNYQALNSLVAGFNRDVLAEPVPDYATAPVRRFSYRTLLPIAASLLVFFLGGLAGWYLQGQSVHTDNRDLIADAVAAHRTYSPEVLHPVEVDAGDSRHLEKWLSKRIGAPITLPNMEKDGLQLLGGRLLPGDDLSPHGQLIYEKSNGERVSVYITRTGNQAHTSTLFTPNDGLGVFYWIDEDLSCAVVVAMYADFDHDETLRISNDIYEQLEL